MTTGRQHQIRAHAEWMKHPVIGDKIYGVPPDVFLTFIEVGWTERHDALLAHRRQALHARRVTFDLPGGPLCLEAPLEADLVAFAQEKMGLEDPDCYFRQHGGEMDSA
jgi:23S rRNA pseudouridine1911/1915/1917 synthase